MAKTNYRFLKQQREMKKDKRQEDKLRRKSNRTEAKLLAEPGQPKLPVGEPEPT